MGEIGSAYVSVLRLVAVLLVVSVIAYYSFEKWDLFGGIYERFLGILKPSGVTSVVMKVIYQPVVAVGVNQSYGLIKLATNSLVEYKLTISPQSCLSFSPDGSVYVLENKTVSSVDIPVYFNYTGSCNDFEFKVTLWLFSQKEGRFIKGQTVTIVPQFDFTNVVSIIPGSGLATVFRTNLKDIAMSGVLNNVSAIGNLRDRGIVVMSNINFPVKLKFTSDADKILVASNKRSNVETIPGNSEYTLLPGEVILILPLKDDGSIFGYYVNLDVGVVFGGKYKDFARLKVRVLSPDGLLGVAFQNTTFLIPVARKRDYFLSVISTSADYVEDTFDFKTFSLVPDLSVLSNSGVASSDWTVVKYDSGRNWIMSVYAYKPDLDAHGISRMYLAQKIVYDGSTTLSDGTRVVSYTVDSFLYYNEDPFLTVFASVVTNPGNANAFSSLLQNSLFYELFNRNDWPKDRAMFITEPTFIISVNGAVYKPKDVSESVSIGNYSYRIWKFPDNVSGIWEVEYPQMEVRKDYTPGTKAYTFTGNGQVVWKLLLAGEEAGYYHLKPGEVLGRGLFDTYFDKFTDFVSDFDVGQTNMACSLIDRIKSFDLRQKHLGCYQQKGNPRVEHLTGYEYYIISPVKIMLAYHQDAPDLTTGVMGHGCRGAGGIMLEREDVISMLAPWTEYWCKAGHDGWVGKKANSLLNLAVSFNVKISFKTSFNVLGTQKIVYKIKYNLVVYLPLLKPYWDSNYLLYYALQRG